MPSKSVFGGYIGTGVVRPETNLRARFKGMITVIVIFPFFYPPFHIQFAIKSHRCNSQTGMGEVKVESCVPRNMTPQTVLLNTHPLNPEASRINVSEETPFN
jgi:hypothetical protein